ncbi:hypothetical protein ALC53_13646 [Atta colombica]|uniref:Uncharacterized protein n=1 Tax=Atta colombica TaxID=520822 RepID=A0A195AV50_9HYME|nr:hypothetical protein ALC53_13646 [Atta colombica]
MIVTQLHSSLSHSMPCTTYNTVVIQSCRISIPKTRFCNACFNVTSIVIVWCLLANCRPSSVLTCLFDRSILLPTTILMISVLLQYVFNSLSHVSNFTKSKLSSCHKNIIVITNPNSKFHYIIVDGNLFCLVVHPDCALHIFVELILSESQEYAGNDFRCENELYFANLPRFPYIGFAYHKNFQYRQIIFLIHNNLLTTTNHCTHNIKSIYQPVNTENKH